MNVYLAGSIDDASDIQKHNWRKEATIVINKAGFDVYNPAIAYSSLTSTDIIQEANFGAIRAADALLVELFHPVKHVGTLLEVGFALALDIPCFIWMGKQYDRHVSLKHHEISQSEDLYLVLDSCVDYLYSLYSDGPVIHETIKIPIGYTLDEEVADPSHIFGVPLKAYPGDAGVDLPAARDIVVPPHGFTDIPLAYRLTPPPDIWYRLVGRSSTLRKLGLLVNEGIIDSGWRGPLFCGVWNMTDKPVPIKAGQRICQAIFHEVPHFEMEPMEMEERPNGDRGEKGFGSTGS